VTVTAGATDLQSGIAAVDLYVDGLKYATDGLTPYSFTWSPRKGSGKRTLTAVAKDVAGNKTTSVPVSVTVK